MTNINCSSDCVYQKDGKCTLESVTAMAVISDTTNACAYYAKAQNNLEEKNNAT
jgi:hypothetical protein